MVDPAPDPDREVMAAELAMGLLEGEERAQALRRCLSDTTFAAEVEQWSARLAPMLDAVPHASPSSQVWDAIAARIGKASAGNVVARLRAWRTGALVAASIAACLAVVIVMRPGQLPPSSQVAIAQLVGSEPSPAIAVAYDQRSGVLRMGSQALAVDGKSPELWVIPADGVPRSLGLMARDGGELTVGSDLRPLFHAGATLAVTMEDSATAPHKAPSASPVMAGKISII